MKMKSATALALFFALAIRTTAVAETTEPTPSVPVTEPVLIRPNVLIWMMDDVGFAQLSSYGGLVDTPNIDRVAQLGLRYTNYHTPPICSASRAAFLTGRNAHSVHIGSHAAAARPYPGYDAKMPPEAGTIAENLRQQGYRTFAVGKWDHLPASSQSASGPFTYWPLGQGFDRFYGFLAADTNNWSPVLVADNSPVSIPYTEDYHLDPDLADKAIGMIRSRSVNLDGAPFLLYLATGTAHAPHHAPAEWLSYYRGRFDAGWDEARNRILSQQIALGILPEGTELPPRPDGMAEWSTLSADAKRLYSRQMEAFAASLSHADEQFGRILDELEFTGELDDTIIIITSDNGASAEGAEHGTYHESTFFNGHYPSVAENLLYLDAWGGPKTYPHYALGWAVAGNTPFRFYKQTTYQGGTRVPMIIAAPGKTPPGELREHFAHVIDLAPTILDLTGTRVMPFVNNVSQVPMEGQSIAGSFSSPDFELQRQAQYFEMFGNMGLWSNGWSIVASRRTRVWDLATVSPPVEKWELYDLNADPGQTRDLADQYPERLEAMVREFEEQASTFNVNPIDDAGGAQAYSAAAQEKEFISRGGVWRYPSPIARIAHSSAPPILHRSFRMSADLDLPTGRETGPIFALGGELGGLGLYLRRGRPVFVLRSLDGSALEVASPKRLARGASHLELEIVRQPSLPLQPVDIQVTLLTDGKRLTSKTVRAELPAAYSISETFDIGQDDGSTLSDAYSAGDPVPGTLRNVSFDFSGQD